MKKILFFGDSITDSGHQNEYKWNMGYGYVNLVVSHLEYEYPGEYECVNRGVSGNRVVDLLAREKRDAINLKPDIISILIGVNDIGHELGSGNGVSPERYYELYSMLVRDIKEALPECKIMMFGSFIFEDENVVEYPTFKVELRKVEAYAKQVAEENGALFVPLWDKFEEQFAGMPSSHWSIDGIHPTNAGHELIKREWLKAFETIR